MDANGPAALSPTKGGLPIVGFADAPAFAAWLAGRDETATGAWLRFAKKGSGATTLSHRGAIDCALCEGWIDGQAAPEDERFFLVRFTPRRPRSNWSQVNRARVDELTAEGRMRPRGSREADAARADGRWDRAYPSSRTATAPDDLRVALEGCPAAAARFAGLNRSERYALLFALANARKDETRRRRIASFLVAAQPSD
ncbi:YdeI/OmpD-associated family protein [Methylobacterium sp. E-005]|uniref:YdeI/OmpD-associated family protein n=1 Tax=Methylobacterium sp. E-005 TaxID=2836549 RepID=UPI001FB9ACFE|nr:YdeI/OmpD-associated family protein [Methylobacterium sp. E-005]MCJ2087645.1 YdeI/OmpD-associated family protein [Methylobacterium sp. E-005]